MTRLVERYSPAGQAIQCLLRRCRIPLGFRAAVRQCGLQKAVFNEQIKLGTAQSYALSEGLCI